MTASGFASLVLDADSTLCGIEGIDWLAERRGAAVSRRVSELTERAMQGDIALDAVYGERLMLVSPTSADIRALGDEYVKQLANGAADAINRLMDSGVRVVLVSGGIRDAILPVARLIGIADTDVHAVHVATDKNGDYKNYDTTSPMANATGKRDVVDALALARRILAVGDGATDLAIRPAVDAFAAFTGFVTRDAVVAQADFTLASFQQLAEMILA